MPRSSDSERGLRALAGALAFFALLSIAFPFADLVLTNLPWELGRVDWRYQVIGRLSQMLMTPMLGLLLLVGAAHLSESRTTARITGLASYLIALALAGLTILFVLDGRGASALVPDEAQAVFRLGGIRAIVKNVFSTGALAIIGWAAFRVAGAMPPKEDRTKDKSALYGN